MFEQLLAISRNTFFESIRQPIVLVVLIIATVALVLSQSLAAFTMENDQHMLVDMGMATIFLLGALLAAFVATGVLTREIENRTALTVISKPVSRPLFVIGKFLGVATALMLCTLYMCFVFALIELHSVLQTVRDPVHVPVVVFGVGGLILGIGGAVWCNYFYGKVFASSAICFLTPLAALAYMFSLMFRYDFAPQPMAASFKPNLWLGLLCLMIAVVVLTAVAVAASARLGQVMTLVVTLGVFMLGLLSDWILGRPLAAIRSQWLDRARLEGMTERVEVVREFVTTSGESQNIFEQEFKEVATVPLTEFAQGMEMIPYWLLHTTRSFVPNFQVLWLSDALTQDHRIPLDYVAMVAAYGALYVVVALCLAIILFQRREVG